MNQMGAESARKVLTFQVSWWSNAAHLVAWTGGAVPISTDHSTSVTASTALARYRRYVLNGSPSTSAAASWLGAARTNVRLSTARSWSPFGSPAEPVDRRRPR